MRGRAVAGGDLALRQRRRHLRRASLPSTTGGCTAIADGATSGTLFAGIQDGSQRRAPLQVARLRQDLDATALNLPGVLVSASSASRRRLVVGLRDGSGGLRGKNNSGAIYYSDDDGAHWTMATGAGSAAVAGIAFNGTNGSSR